MTPPPDVSQLTEAEKDALILALWTRVAELETADDMRRAGVRDATAHQKIALRHLGGKAGTVTDPIKGER
jgi:hypothetical protein